MCSSDLTNTFHGTAFEFIRNDNFDAPRWEDNAFRSGTKPEFKRNQFGGTLGGPILRDKTFFFGSYEGLRERLGTVDSPLVPSAEARTGVLRNYNAVGQPIVATVNVANQVRPYLDLYPLPNAGLEGTGTGRYSWAGSNNTDQNDVVAKFDHQLTNADSLMGRIFFDDSGTYVPNNLGLLAAVNDSRIQSYVLNHKRIFGASLVNDFRFAFNRQNLSADNDIPEKLNALE